MKVMSKNPLKVCSRCVMDTSDSSIQFDNNGVCDHCRNFDKKINSDVMLSDFKDEITFSKDEINDYINFEASAFNINKNKTEMSKSAKKLTEALMGEFKNEYLDNDTKTTAYLKKKNEYSGYKHIDYAYNKENSQEGN